MASIFDKFPGRQGLLEKPVVVENTNGNVIIVREFDRSALSVGLFDFDGTISDERVGWPNLMVASNMAFLIALSSPQLPHKTAEKMVIEDIEKTIGIPTYMQMKRLRTMIENSGYTGQELDPKMFKDAYNDALVSMVASRRAKLGTGEMTRDDLLIPGAAELLPQLQKKLPKGIYLASGTDETAVMESVEELGFSKYFPRERIVGAGTLAPEKDAKEAVINNMLHNKGIRGEELLTFGDGFPEVLYTHLAGGVAVGVVSRDKSHYEHQGHFTIEQKEQRLINAGAHIIVRNPFENVQLLLETIFTGHDVRN
ncbi:MAG: HAD hydrolase-like protein [Deferribacteres bacterium]|nr:HAD hydrolase-like protein [Deferribacteres bacterium]